MNSEEIKTRLKGRVRTTPAKFEVLWDELVKDDRIRYVEEGDDDFEDLCEEAEKRLDRAAALSGADNRSGRRKVERSPEEFLTKVDKDRAAALASYLALLADNDWDVKELRIRLFAGRLLSKEEATHLLESQVARVMEFEEFSQFRIPLLNHSAFIEVLPRHGKAEPKECNHLRIYYEVGDDRVRINYRRVIGSKVDKLLGPCELAVPSPHTPPSTHWLPIWRRSVLDEVRVVSESIVERYGFRPHEATWYILTGTPAIVRPLDFRYSFPGGWSMVGPRQFEPRMNRNLPLLTLTLAPWVSAVAVKEAIKEFQAAASFMKGNREVPRSIEVLKFVSDAIRASGEPNWKELLKSWNKKAKAQPKWQFKYPSDLETAYKRAVTTIVMLLPVNQPVRKKP